MSVVKRGGKILLCLLNTHSDVSKINAYCKGTRQKQMSLPMIIVYGTKIHCYHKVKNQSPCSMLYHEHQCMDIRIINYECLTQN